MGNDLMPKLIKCLELTASNHDGEVLSAIRKANEFRLRMNKSWTEIFALKSIIVTSKHSTPYQSEYQRIDEMLECLLELEGTLSEKTFNFIASLDKSFNKYKRLSEKQLEWLEILFEEHCNG